MSVYTLSRFAAQLALDYDMLEIYADAKTRPRLFPKVEVDEDVQDPAECNEIRYSQIRALYGDLSDEEIELLESGDYSKIFRTINSERPRSDGDRNPNPPDTNTGGGGG